MIDIVIVHLVNLVGGRCQRAPLDHEYLPCKDLSHRDSYIGEKGQYISWHGRMS